MNLFIRVLTLAVLGLQSAQLMADAKPQVIHPDQMPWISPPALSGLSASWMLGKETEQTPYLLRVILRQGTQIPVHTHPDERQTTVLKGTLYVGFGDTFDAQQLVAVPEGSVYIAPAHQAHYLWAKDGDVLYQEAGIGPTRTTFNAH